MMNLSNRDLGLVSIGHIDLEAQLIAVRGVLTRNRQAEKEAVREIEDLGQHLRAFADRNDEYLMHLQNSWVDELHAAVYQDAAHSMSAVGMLAPLIEALFIAIFQAAREIEAEKGGRAQTNARRSQSDDEYWNPRLAFNRSGRAKDIVAGIQQLAESTGLSEFLPSDLGKTLAALFAYRNKMFHLGFEWPAEERRKFLKRIQEESWGEAWFKQSTQNDEPWIFYMSEDFIRHCLFLIDEVLDGVGRYVRASLAEKPVLRGS